MVDLCSSAMLEDLVVTMVALLLVAELWGRWAFRQDIPNPFKRRMTLTLLSCICAPLLRVNGLWKAIFILGVILSGKHARWRRPRIVFVGNYPKLKLASPTLTQKSPLLTLPGELRNKIYRLVLVRNESIDILSTRLSYRDDELNESALLATCRQIREESSSIFYRENAFLRRLDLTDLIYRVHKIPCRSEAWLRALGKGRAALLNEYRIDFRSSSLVCCNQSRHPIVEEEILKSVRDMIASDSDMRSTEPYAFGISEVRWTTEARRYLAELRRCGLRMESISLTLPNPVRADMGLRTYAFHEALKLVQRDFAAHGDAAFCKSWFRAVLEYFDLE